MKSKGNEIATGQDVLHPSEMGANSQHEFSNVDSYNVGDNSVEVDADVHPVSSEVPSGSEVPSAHTVSSSRPRGRPRVESSTFQPSKKTKAGIDKISSSLKQIATALKALAAASTSVSEANFTKFVHETVVEMFGADIRSRIKASRYLIHHRQEACLIMAAPKEERRMLLDEYMDTAND